MTVSTITDRVMHLEYYIDMITQIARMARDDDFGRLARLLEVALEDEAQRLRHDLQSQVVKALRRIPPV